MRRRCKRQASRPRHAGVLNVFVEVDVLQCLGVLAFQALEELHGGILFSRGPARGPFAHSSGNLSPNIGSPLFEAARVASSWMTSQCSARTPFSRRTTSTTIQLGVPAPRPEKRPCNIKKSPFAKIS